MIIMEYFYSQNYEGYIYTIDMFRISTRVTRFDKKEIIKFLTMQNLKFWNNKQAGKYDENFQADKLWLGLMEEKIHDFGHDINENILFTLEFNPNKITDRDIFIYNYFINNYNFTIKRFDLAVDIPHNINNLCFFDIYKKCFSIFYKDFDNKTYYIGKGNGHIKIYNKKIESQLDYELTRFEITKEVELPLNSLIPYFVDFKFPVLAFQPYYGLSDYEDSDTLRAIVYAVNNGYPYANLSRRYKELIKKDFIGLTDLNNEVANEVLHKFVARVENRHI